MIICRFSDGSNMRNEGKSRIKSTPTLDVVGEGDITMLSIKKERSKLVMEKY